MNPDDSLLRYNFLEDSLQPISLSSGYNTGYGLKMPSTYSTTWGLGSTGTEASSGLWDDFKKGFDSFLTPHGSGPNARSYADLALGALNMLENYRNNKATLAIRRQALEDARNTQRANFGTNATALGNDLMTRARMANGWSSDFGAGVAQDSLASLNQLSQAGQSIGYNPSNLEAQKNQLRQYNSLS